MRSRDLGHHLAAYLELLPVIELEGVRGKTWVQSSGSCGVGRSSNLAAGRGEHMAGTTADIGE